MEMLGLEVEVATGHIDAGDDAVPKGFGAHTGVIVDLGPLFRQGSPRGEAILSHQW